MFKYCYLDGSYVSRKNACISVSDIGFLRGFGVFDFIKIYSGVPFMFEEHVDRLAFSARSLGIAISKKQVKEFREIVRILLKKNKIGDSNAYIRIVVTGGRAINGIEFKASDPTVFVAVEPSEPLPKRVYTKGGKLMTCEHQRLHPEYKTTNYVTAVSLQKEKKKQKAVEILYINKGNVLEAATSNLFIVKNRKLITPHKSILCGLTRRKVIERARELGYTVTEREVKQKELYAADEVFITAANKEIVPITRVDDRTISTGSVGEHTRTLSGDLNDYIARYVTEHEGDWR